MIDTEYRLKSHLIFKFLSSFYDKQKSISATIEFFQGCLIILTIVCILSYIHSYKLKYDGSLRCNHFSLGNIITSCQRLFIAERLLLGVHLMHIYEASLNLSFCYKFLQGKHLAYWFSLFLVNVILVKFHAILLY